MQAQFTVAGDPKGKQRPRTVHTSKGIKTYTPDQTVVYENYIRYSYSQQCRGIFLNGAIEARITAFFSIPKSVSKKKRQKMLDQEIMHTKKIDCDNLAKAVLDALNKVAYNDDSQISRLIVEKYYAERPMVRISLKEIDDLP